MRMSFSNLIAFDDAPFALDQSEPVKLVGAVFAGTRFDGVLIGDIKKDGDDATSCIIKLISDSKFREHIQFLMLQGITFAGFNVVDPNQICNALCLPVLIVTRKEPDFAAIREALFKHVPGGEEKWRIIESIGPMESLNEIWIQRVEISREDAESTLRKFTLHGQIPEPLRVAHLIAGALGTGESKGRV